LAQATRYPFDGAVQIDVRPERSATFAVHVRIPAWAEQSTVEVNGERIPGPFEPDTFAALRRTWQNGDRITLRFAMPPMFHEPASRSVQESRAPDGTAISQEVMHYDYVALTRGPLVYATGLIDDFKIDETIRLPRSDWHARLAVLDPPVGYEGPA